MVEAGHRRPTLDFAQRCDRFFETGTAFTYLIRMMGREWVPSWFRAFTAHEEQAVAIQTCDVHVVPGLFQARDYIRALLLTAWPPPSEARLEELVSFRLERQKILDRDRPPIITAILDESVLRRPIGGAAAMAQQLDRLVELARRPNIRIHMVTYAQSARCAPPGPFTLLELPSGKRFLYAEAVEAGNLLPERRVLDSYTNLLSGILGEALSWSDSIAFIERLKRELYENDRPPVMEEQP